MTVEKFTVVVVTPDGATVSYRDVYNYSIRRGRLRLKRDFWTRVAVYERGAWSFFYDSAKAL